VHVLRTLDDANGLNQAMQRGCRLVIIGGGYVGLEVAATARKRGLDVTVLEAEDRVLARIAGKDISTFFEQTHKAKGVNIITGAMAQAFEGDQKLSGVRLADGTVLPADLALVGIGLIPNEDLAHSAGLACDNGIVVDALCRTEDPNIFAIGDVTRHPNEVYGRTLRLESVHNALEQAKTAAGAIMGRDKPYNQVPWFWSDQYDIKLQIAGLSEGYAHTVLRGDQDQNSFAVFYFKEDVLIACDAVNAPAEYMAARMMIAKGAKPDRAMLVDMEVPMKEIMVGAK
jgi:3-phenylpropionate/trans-cinnamate dioxygenase ferredoxin reductase subunit